MHSYSTNYFINPIVDKLCHASNANHSYFDKTSSYSTRRDIFNDHSNCGQYELAGSSTCYNNNIGGKNLLGAFGSMELLQDKNKDNTSCTIHHDAFIGKQNPCNNKFGEKETRSTIETFISTASYNQGLAVTKIIAFSVQVMLKLLMQ